MKLVTQAGYLAFLRKHRYVTIGNCIVRLTASLEIESLQPREFSVEKANVWDFPNRGSWATHSGAYRGNWSPLVPRNLLLRYTEEGDTVLDQMMGGGTTLVECRLLNRRAIGIDINPTAVIVTLDRLNFTLPPTFAQPNGPEILTYEGDARNLDKIGDDSIDLVATHPPYLNIIPYSADGTLAGDLSRIADVADYVKEISRVADECYRVLRPGKNCAILIGDTRRRKHHVPLAFRVMQIFLRTGFILQEDIVKLQRNVKSTRDRWPVRRYNFLLLSYEHLFIFRKPLPQESTADYRGSITCQDPA